MNSSLTLSRATESAFHYTVLDVARHFGLLPHQAMRWIVVKEGDLVHRGATLATLSLKKKVVEYTAPFTGVIKSILGGRILLVAPQPQQLPPPENPLLRAVWGAGDSVCGMLQILTATRMASISAAMIKKDASEGSILVCSHALNISILEAAKRCGVAGIVAASASATLLPTIHDSTCPVILTEGFGQRQMSAQTWLLLFSHQNIPVQLQTTPRPGVALLSVPATTVTSAKVADRLTVGAQVRALRPPYQDLVGTLLAMDGQEGLAKDVTPTPTAKVKMLTGAIVSIPLVNLAVA